MLAEQALVARQPICDRANSLVAYELLFRASHADGAEVQSPEVATAAVAVQAVMDIGLDELVGARRAWINLPRLALTGEHFRFLPPERVVLEVLETVEADEGVVCALRRAREAGYQIALDDFVLNERTAGLVALADYVKLDVLDRREDDIAAAVRALQRPGLRFLAEKVESREVHEAALRAGCHLFQGYYFARPDIVPGRRMPTDRNALLRLLAELQDPETPLERIEELVAADLGLSARLLRYVNAAIHGVRERIDSLRHAIVMLGHERLRDCVTMLLLAGLDGKPSQLVTMALVRARLCEMLGQRAHGEPHRHFSAGLLSLLDAFLDQPLEVILAQMELSPDLVEALVAQKGELGASLQVAVACEHADWATLEGSPWDAKALLACYVEAVSWSNRVQASLTAP